jgi:hypothetical protein
VSNKTTHGKNAKNVPSFYTCPSLSPLINDKNNGANALIYVTAFEGQASIILVKDSSPFISFTQSYQP